MPRWGEVGPLVGGGCAPFFVVTEEGLVPMAVRNVARRSLGGGWPFSVFRTDPSEPGFELRLALPAACLVPARQRLRFREARAGASSRGGRVRRRVAPPQAHSELGRLPFWEVDPFRQRIRTVSGIASRRSCSGATSSRAFEIPPGGSNRSPYSAPTHQGGGFEPRLAAPAAGLAPARDQVAPPAAQLGGWPFSVFGGGPPGHRIRTTSGCASRRSCSGRTFSPASTSPLGGSNPHSCRNAKGTPRGALRISGRGERIRTSDLSVPNRALYQAEPRPDEGLTLLETARGVQRAPIRIRGRGEFALCGGPRGDGGRGAGGRDPRGVRGPRPEGRRE